MFLSANVLFEFSSRILHVTLKLNSHLYVKHVNTTYSSFYLCVSDELSGCVVFPLPIGLNLSV